MNKCKLRLIFQTQAIRLQYWTSKTGVRIHLLFHFFNGIRENLFKTRPNVLGECNVFFQLKCKLFQIPQKTGLLAQAQTQETLRTQTQDTRQSKFSLLAKNKKRYRLTVISQVNVQQSGYAVQNKSNVNLTGHRPDTKSREIQHACRGSRQRRFTVNKDEPTTDTGKHTAKYTKREVINQVQVKLIRAKQIIRKYFTVQVNCLTPQMKCSLVLEVTLGRKVTLISQLMRLQLG